MSYKIQQAKSLSNTTNVDKSLGKADTLFNLHLFVLDKKSVPPLFTTIAATLYNNAAPQIVFRDGAETIGRRIFLPHGQQHSPIGRGFLIPSVNSTSRVK